MNQVKAQSQVSNQGSTLAPRDVSRVSFFGGGGGGGGGSEWTNIPAGDLNLDGQSYTGTFALSASGVAGYDHRIDISSDTGAATNTFNMAQAGIIWFDTGISLDTLTTEEGTQGVLQLQFEPAGVDSSSTYYTDTAHPLSVILWCGFDIPPFALGDMVYYGAGLQLRANAGGTNNDGWYHQTRIMRSQNTTTAIQGFSYGFGYRFQNLAMTATFGKTRDATIDLAISQVDWNGTIYRNDPGIYVDYAMLATISQVTDFLNTKTNNTSTTIKIGIALNVGTTIDATIHGWDFNLKWRKLLIQ